MIYRRTALTLTHHIGLDCWETNGIRYRSGAGQRKAEGSQQVDIISAMFHTSTEVPRA